MWLWFAFSLYLLLWLFTYIFILKNHSKSEPACDRDLNENEAKVICIFDVDASFSLNLITCMLWCRIKEWKWTTQRSKTLLNFPILRIWMGKILFNHIKFSFWMITSNKNRFKFNPIIVKWSISENLIILIFLNVF